MLPRSLTADFNFPAWHYYGCGSGEERAYHHYELRPVDIRRQDGLPPISGPALKLEFGAG